MFQRKKCDSGESYFFSIGILFYTNEKSVFCSIKTFLGIKYMQKKRNEREKRTEE